MSNELAVTEAAGSPDVFEASLAAEESAERGLMHSMIKGVVIATPIGIAFFVGLLALAVGDHTEWYVWVLLGGLMGVLAGVLFGVLGSVTLAAHKLDEIDRQTYG